ncbi:uncharacterized protein K441DRAFT_661632 [Cenococcum geophilum 1.58]|uniref:uncharacterized protein n=1 Tax=Cenococcum geophilum 1.58 TaxID=794803 RepID=UPI00358DFAB4|nr:hypothetical protein K441DRAFT_661632 [Cenococcum geophilum 1.58]
MVWAAFYEWGNITAQGFLDHIYPKLKEFYDFYNAEYDVYFPDYEFGINSPDLNLIKARKPCLLIKEAMQAAIKSEWENLEACYFEDLVASMPARL